MIKSLLEYEKKLKMNLLMLMKFMVFLLIQDIQFERILGTNQINLYTFMMTKSKNYAYMFM